MNGQIGVYFATNRTHKLHIGAGGCLLGPRGWLDTDIEPRWPDKIVQLNATKPMGFEDNTFDYVFTEHVIEHMPYESGVAMLKEINRVLKPGGKLRISCPDLRFLIALYEDKLTDTQKAYLKRAAWSDKSKAEVPHPTPCFVVNWFVRMGFPSPASHQFIYDEETLTAAMYEVGFNPIQRCELMKSDDPELEGLEAEWRLPPGFLALESMTFEGTKVKP